MTTKVVVQGALGRMGREVVSAVVRDPELEVVGALELEVTQDYLPLPDGSGLVPLSSDAVSLLKNCCPDVLVDFSVAEATMSVVPVAVNRHINMVIGTTGLSADDLAQIEHLAKESEVGVVVAPNFALGAVLLVHLAKVSARFFDYAEIIEMHHQAKIDAPSGTALATARAMLAERGKPFSYSAAQKEALAGSRGGQMGGIALHSVRLPGLMAHQEVILGGAGQTLSLRHDTINRECYMPGVILAIKEVQKHKGLVYGLDSLLGL